MPKTESGREKNYRCPYCDFPAYSIYNLNMHIASKHSGKPTIAVADKGNAKVKPKLTSIKSAMQKAYQRAPDPDKEEDDQEQDEDEDEDDIYG